MQGLACILFHVLLDHIFTKDCWYFLFVFFLLLLMWQTSDVNTVVYEVSCIENNCNLIKETNWVILSTSFNYAPLGLWRTDWRWFESKVTRYRSSSTTTHSNIVRCIICSIDKWIKKLCSHLKNKMGGKMWTVWFVIL